MTAIQKMMTKLLKSNNPDLRLKKYAPQLPHISNSDLLSFTPREIAAINSINTKTITNEPSHTHLSSLEYEEVLTYSEQSRNQDELIDGMGQEEMVDYITKNQGDFEHRVKLHPVENTRFQNEGVSILQLPTETATLVWVYNGGAVPSGFDSVYVPIPSGTAFIGVSVIGSGLALSSIDFNGSPLGVGNYFDTSAAASGFSVYNSTNVAIPVGQTRYFSVEGLGGVTAHVMNGLKSSVERVDYTRTSMTIEFYKNG
jgi:hypothetical protein